MRAKSGVWVWDSGCPVVGKNCITTSVDFLFLIQINDADVEDFLIDLLKTKLVRAKIDQANKVVTVSSTMHRTFTKQHWHNLQGLLTNWRTNLHNLRGQVRSNLANEISTLDVSAFNVSSFPDCAFVRGPDEHEATSAGSAAATSPGPRDLGPPVESSDLIPPFLTFFASLSNLSRWRLIKGRGGDPGGRGPGLGLLGLGLLNCVLRGKGNL